MLPLTRRCWGPAVYSRGWRICVLVLQLKIYPPLALPVTASRLVPELTPLRDGDLVILARDKVKI